MKKYDFLYSKIQGSSQGVKYPDSLFELIFFRGGVYPPVHQTPYPSAYKQRHTGSSWGNVEPRRRMTRETTEQGRRPKSDYTLKPGWNLTAWRRCAVVGQFYKTLSGKGNKDSNRHFENNIGYKEYCFQMQYFFKEISWSIFVIIHCHCNNC